ncbi:MAG TPA: hypothetical protein VFL99_06920 [Segeticoccus sp.]|uniref:hypothetical protein n=1 Tax=Segeticoccus sp. TaxID=2706531 RepID=UPI002D7E2F60|nr:hypothetical protein [Segeticoccus sp.]HET8600041.1 hypothetical protein [Segeticoccus sp.]
MLVAAAVVPGTPALLPGVVGDADSDVAPARESACAAVASVLTRLLGSGGRPIGRLVVVAEGDPADEAGSRSHDLAGKLVDRSFGPSVELAALPGARPPLPHVPGERPADESLVPTPLLVARALCGEVARAEPATKELWSETLWVTVTPGAAAGYGHTLEHDLAPVGLVLVAGGAAPHGPEDPAALAPQAAAYDESVCAALASGDPEAVAALDSAAGTDLSAEGAGLWPALAVASRGAPWRADLRWRGSPYGVGWFVADWHRAPA